MTQHSSLDAADDSGGDGHPPAGSGDAAANQPGQTPPRAEGELAKSPDGDSIELTPVALVRSLAAAELSGRSSAAVGDELHPVVLAQPVVPPLPSGDAYEAYRARRRVGLPLTLFIVTCFSTFFVGTANWVPDELLERMFTSGEPFMVLRGEIIRHGSQGLIYMGCVLAILLTHEMGHFLASVRHRIPASLPFFIPLPIIPLGTMGAVIGMDGMRANRRQLFDIGIAGPLAGLVVAIPILWIGVQQLTPPQQAAFNRYAIDLPYLANWFIALRGDFPRLEPPQLSITQINPYFMAGWVGLLITGLNMMPVSQLDGGHVVYTLFGERAKTIARGFLFFAIAFVVFYPGAHNWWLMVVLVTLIGVDHPPTANDSMPLGPVRTAIGYASLAIPFFCFPPRGLIPMGL